MSYILVLAITMLSGRGEWLVLDSQMTSSECTLALMRTNHELATRSLTINGTTIELFCALEQGEQS